MSGGLGTADVGGAWTASAGSNRQSVSAGTATLNLPNPGNNTGSYLGDVSATDVDLTATLSVSSMPTGGGTYVYLSGRRVAANLDYRPRLRLTPDGQVAVALSRLAGGESWPGGEQIVPDVTFSAGTALATRVVVTGTSPTQISLTVWEAGTTEPATPTMSWTDDTAALQAPGAVGLSSYLTGSSTAGTSVLVTGVEAVVPDGGGDEPPAENQAPTAAFTAASDALTVAVDGSGSADADGTVDSFAWDFGDGATGTGATVSHTYAAAGTYTVTLTVTDDAGATATADQQVTVEAVTEEPRRPTAPSPVTPSTGRCPVAWARQTLAARGRCGPVGRGSRWTRASRRSPLARATTPAPTWPASRRPVPTCGRRCRCRRCRAAGRGPTCTWWVATSASTRSTRLGCGCCPTAASACRRCGSTGRATRLCSDRS
ncbi:PKD domain-containing protein [Blastococcus brunescens]|uniref:PKD domain-containing protein n=1 Tax=Blastococcus brunescens TaxID=1564165 RepID=A0ABZ1B5S4_9ACTN|nr:PKD domain-containing protein [Blastococcus sp. BMG 8361]WRL64729.1 PKD domain-containing protein [Blastococcus sp. BMG 8361]